MLNELDGIFLNTLKTVQDSQTKLACPFLQNGAGQTTNKEFEWFSFKVPRIHVVGLIHAWMTRCVFS